MILDTTYLLRLSKIKIDTDLLGLIADGKTELEFDNLGISSISLFEIQAKAAKSNLPPKYAIEAIDVINSEFRVENFYNPRVVEIASALSKRLNDYIDCLILSTAIALKEDLATEDSKLHNIKKQIKEEYGIKIMNYAEFAGR